MAKRTSVYLSNGTLAYVAARRDSDDSLSGIINAAIDRLDYLLTDAQPHLSPSEWDLICQVREGAANTPVSQAVSSVVGMIEDSIRAKGLDKEHNVDGVTLLAKLRELDRAGLMAVIDYAEREKTTV